METIASTQAINRFPNRKCWECGADISHLPITTSIFPDDMWKMLKIQKLEKLCLDCRPQEKEALS